MKARKARATDYSADDLRILRQMMADGASARSCADRLNRSRESVLRSASRHKLGKWKDGRPDLKRVPDGFAEAWQKHPIRQLTVIFSASANTVQRWVHECGLKRPKGPIREDKPEAVATTKKAVRIVNRVAAPIDRPHIDNTLPGRAAEFLRRFGPVVRCSMSGSYDPRGDYWRRGSTILSAQDVVERAYRNGWNPDAWQQVAA